MTRFRIWLASAWVAAAIAGCGGDTTSTDSGPGDSGMRADGTVPLDGAADGGGDPCSGLTLCTTAGTSCDGDSLVTCAENADGCMVETTEDCGLGGEVCSDASGTAACVDPCSLIPAADACTTDGARTCTGETLEVCAMNADGCLVLDRTDCAASAGGQCDDSGTMPVCALPPDPCASIPAADRCTTDGETSCDGATLVECQADAFGCLVNVRTDCSTRAGGTCTTGAGAGYECGGFTGDPCAGVTTCATAGTSCEGPTLVTCAADAFGCMVETRTACDDTMFGFCDTAASPNACSTAATDPCMGVTQCDPATPRACTDRSTLTTCAANAFGCYVATDTDCTTTSQVCDATGGTPVCVDPCSLVTTCPGASYCDGSDVVTCTANADGCLVESARTACVAPLSCDAASGACVDLCPEAGTRVLDCASGTVTGDTAMGTTANAGSYGDCYDGTNYAGAEQYWRFSHTGTAPMQVTITSTRGAATGDYDLFVLEDSTTCTDAAPVCLDGSRGVGATETVSFRAEPGSSAFVAYDLWSTTATTAYTLAVTCQPIVCGDGQVVGDETCDDGNTTAGDGCSAICEVETGSVCYGSPSICGAALACGNGVRETGEACDDGNTAAADGCSATCTVETGYGCTTASPNVCTLLCGNGTVNTSAGESCDDTNRTDGDGCSSTCTIESGYACSGTPSVCVPSAANATCASATAITGTTTIAGETIALGGPRPQGTGCGTSSGNNALYYAVTIPAATSVVVTTAGTFDRVLLVQDACGATSCTYRTDASPETATLTNSGTSPVTRIVAIHNYSSGTTGTYSISFQYPVCGDGVVSPGEGCDDGGTAGGNGCSATCTVESGYSCTGSPSVCTMLAANGTCAGATAITLPQTITGENLATGGPRPQGTGCGTSSGNNALYYALTIPAGGTVQVQVTELNPTTWDSVILSQSACSDTTCASRVDTTSATETMSISNPTSGPVSRIVAVHNYGSSAMGSYDISFAVTRTCGNGTLEPLETCEDGNLTAGDGCAPTCTVEPGWVCTGTPSTCTRPYTASAITAACVTTGTWTSLARSSMTSDDATTAIAALPFSMSYFGDTVTHFSTSTNGFAQLWTSATGTPSSTFSNATIPNASAPNGTVAAFWDDIYLGAAFDIRTQTLGTAGSQTFVIEWNDALAGSGGEPLTFQVQLHEATGVVEVHYCSVGTGTRASGESATVGIENVTGTVGVLTSYNTAGAVTAGSGYRYTPNP